jgi:hypothetical protein
MSDGPVNRYEAFYATPQIRNIIVELPEQDMLALRTRAAAAGVNVHQLAAQVLSAAAHWNGAVFSESAV